MGHLPISSHRNVYSPLGQWDTCPSPHTGMCTHLWGNGTLAHLLTQECVLTSGAMGHLPISSHRNVYSPLGQWDTCPSPHTGMCTHLWGDGTLAHLLTQECILTSGVMGHLPISSHRNVYSPLGRWDTCPSPHTGMHTYLWGDGTLAHLLTQECVLTSGAMGHLPISSHRNAYSTLVSPAPYLRSGSLSSGTNMFHNPSCLALTYR